MKTEKKATSSSPTQSPSESTSLTHEDLKVLKAPFPKDRLGVKVQSVSVIYLAAPDEVKPAFDQVMITQANIHTQENDARQEAFRLQRKAQADENDLLQQADAYAQGRQRLAQAEADAFLTRCEQYRRLKKDNPDILTAIWWAEMGKTLANLKANGQVDILDEHIGADGLDITQFARPKKK